MKQRPAKFRFKSFELSDTVSAMKIGTDGVLLGAWALAGSQPTRIADAGGGTGLIALMLAQRFPQAHITGIELDEAAAEEARENVAESPWPGRVEIVRSDFLEWRGEVDAIVSNPPFFTTGELSPTPTRATARHEGLLTMETLTSHAAELLRDGGRLAMISPAERADDITYRMTMARLDPSRITMIAPTAGAAPIRVMIEAVKGISKTFSTNTLVLRRDNGERTEDYHNLTSDFYLDK